MRRNAAFAAQRDQDQRRAVLRCVGVAGSIVGIGAVGFHAIEGWSYWESTYFTLVTISTVGYGDYGLTEQGKVFAAFLLVCGIGAFTYSLTTIVQIASDLDAALRRKMRRQIAACDQHVIVCGFGRIGRMVCEEVDRSGKRCVVIERDPNRVQAAISEGRLVVSGVASEDTILMAAGVTRASSIVCAVDSDAENLYITVSVHDLAPECRIISRAESPDAARKLERAGASLVVSPHQMAGKTIATALIHPRLTRFLHGAAASAEETCCFELGEVLIEEGSEAEGASVREIGQRLSGLVFVAIDREDSAPIVQPSGEERFEATDVVIFAGAGEVVSRMHRFAAESAAPALV